MSKPVRIDSRSRTSTVITQSPAGEVVGNGKLLDIWINSIYTLKKIRCIRLQLQIYCYCVGKFSKVMKVTLEI